MRSFANKSILVKLKRFVSELNFTYENNKNKSINKANALKNKITEAIIILSSY